MAEKIKGTIVRSTPKAVLLLEENEVEDWWPLSQVTIQNDAETKYLDNDNLSDHVGEKVVLNAPSWLVEKKDEERKAPPAKPEDADPYAGQDDDEWEDDDCPF